MFDVRATARERRKPCRLVGGVVQLMLRTISNVLQKMEYLETEPDERGIDCTTCRRGRTIPRQVPCRAVGHNVATIRTSMALPNGTFIGQYEILAALGTGGMGEVYRAQDHTLRRLVAIKVLPVALAGDPERVARFAREAHLLAALSHPNIAQIYGIAQSASVQALVLELVEGVTLARHLSSGAMPHEEAIAIARQIAEALEAAHQIGIVHRDLKPANVMIRPDGTVKVLDFGVAKAFDAPDAATGGSAPTAVDATSAGMIVGTAPYMSPEQARGEPVDARSDIWTFGVVLFEMLSGAPLFARPTIAETTAAVLHAEPDWRRVSPPTRRLLQACLQKNRRHRLRHIGDATLLIDPPEDTHAPVRESRRSSWLPWAVAALCAAIAAIAVWVALRTPAVPVDSVRFQVSASGELPASAASAISPDGRYLAYLATGQDRIMRVRVLDLRSLEDRVLPGTEITQAAPPPFWSPDSRFIAFDAGGALKKIEVTGGLAQTICVIRNPAIGGTWNRQGVILFGNVTGGVQRVVDGGGDPEPVTTLDATRGENAHLAPVFLADGRHFLYLRASRARPEMNGIFVGSLDASPTEQSVERLLATTTSVVYARATSNGRPQVLFLRDGNLMTQDLDESRLVLAGTPALVRERVHSYLDTATVSVSDTGTIVYKGAEPYAELQWSDRRGRPAGRAAEAGLFHGLSISPDGTRAAVARVNPQATSHASMTLLDLADGTLRQLVSPSGHEAAVWSPDGSEVALAQGTTDGVILAASTRGTGTTRPIVSMPATRVAPSSWSPNGQLLLIVRVDPRTNSDLWVVSSAGGAQPEPFLRGAAAESQGQFYPGPKEAARWVAFTTNDSGRDEVQVCAFPDGGNPTRVSEAGGHSPRWRRDGGELFFIAADGMLMAAAVSTEPFQVGAPLPLFPAPRGFAALDATGRRGPSPWDVTPDGQRFLFVTPVNPGDASQFTVVLNWRNRPSG